MIDKQLLKSKILKKTIRITIAIANSMAVKKYAQLGGICQPRIINTYRYGKEMNLLAKRQGFWKTFSNK